MRASRFGTVLLAASAMVLVAGVGSADAHGKPPKPAPSPTVPLQILSFNDYHGHLEPPTGTDATVLTAAGAVNAGGVAYLTTHLNQLRAGHENSLTVAAGDLIGGSPFLSGLFKDEPSIETLNTLGLDVTSVGNHEFDEGVTELLRMQYGGCHPVEGCYDADGYSGADFGYLAANVTYNRVPRHQLAGHDPVEQLGRAVQGHHRADLRADRPAQTPTTDLAAGVVMPYFALGALPFSISPSRSVHGPAETGWTVNRRPYGCVVLSVNVSVLL